MSETDHELHSGVALVMNAPTQCMCMHDVSGGFHLTMVSPGAMHLEGA